MTAYDLRARSTAGHMLAPVSQGGKGQLVTLRDIGSGAYDPATSAASTSPTDQTGSGVEDGVAHRDRPGTQILAGDKRFLLSPFALDGSVIVRPKVDSLCIFGDGATWRLVDIEAVAPAGTPVLFTLHMRS